MMNLFKNDGSSMSFEQLPGDRAPLRPGFGARQINVERGSGEPELVDHSWMDELSPPPFVGRDVALDNTPALARFKDFGNNVVDEIRREEEQAEFELNRSVHRQVIDKIQDILNQALEDHEKELKIKAVVEDAQDAGWEVTAGAKFLQDQVGVAGNLYVISGRNEQECKKHAAQLRKRPPGSPKLQFVAMRVGSRMDPNAVARIYGLPVREKVRLTGSDLGPRRVLAGMRGSLASKYRQLRKQEVQKKIAAAEKQSRIMVDPKRPRETKTASQPARESVKKTNFLHNMVFAALAKRDFAKLRELSRPSNPITAKFGGPRAYRAAVVEVLSTVPGFRLNPDDFKEMAGTRISVGTVAKKLHLSRDEMAGLKSALENNVVMSRENCAACGEGLSPEEADKKVEGKWAGWGERDIIHTDGIIDRSLDHVNDDNGNPDHRVKKAPGVEDIPAAKYSSLPAGVESLRKGMGRQVGLPTQLAARTEYHDAKKPVLPNEAFLEQQLGVNWGDEQGGAITPDLTMHDAFNPQQKPFFT